MKISNLNLENTGSSRVTYQGKYREDFVEVRLLQDSPNAAFHCASEFKRILDQWTRELKSRMKLSKL